MIADMDVRIARSRSELEAAFSLVYSEYHRRGYVEGSGKGLRITHHNALRETATFVGIDDAGQVRATATVVPDSPWGVPMDDCYQKPMDDLRRQGRLCEVVMLALDQGASRAERRALGLSVFSLFKTLVDYARNVLACDFIAAAFNPRHEVAFAHFLFEPLGGLTTYRSANGAPAFARYLDFRTLEARLASAGGGNREKVYGGPPTESACFEGRYVLKKEDLDYFFHERNHLIHTLPPGAFSSLAACYDEEATP